MESLRQHASEAFSDSERSPQDIWVSMLMELRQGARDVAVDLDIMTVPVLDRPNSDSLVEGVVQAITYEGFGEESDEIFAMEQLVADFPSVMRERFPELENVIIQHILTHDLDMGETAYRIGDAEAEMAANIANSLPDELLKAIMGHITIVSDELLQGNQG